MSRERAMHFHPLRLSVLLSLAALASSALAQPAAPRIGYVYPAGGRQGATFQIVVGGQNLDGVTNVYLSGAGAQASVIDFNKPMPQGQFNMLRDKLKELQEKKAAAAKSTRKGNRSQPSTNDWTAADEKLMAEIRLKILKNPPNRNATVAIAEVATVKVTLAPEAEPGVREIRLGTPNGVSNPLAFHVGLLPEFSELAAKAPNPDADRFRERMGKQARSATPEPAVSIAIPATVNGQIMPGDVDRYRFSATKGQQLVIAVSARELIPYLADAVPGWFQATLTLFDSKGKELAYDDDFRFHPDPVLHYAIPADGQYRIEIKDAIYRGREDFVYRIALGELPFITSVFPLGAQASTAASVELKGWNLPQTTLKPEVGRDSGVQLLSVRKETQPSNLMPFVVDSLPEVREQEPNHDSSSAQKITLPMVINGRVDAPGDVDVFCFTGRAGEEIVAEVLARRLNSPLDSALRLTDASGAQLAFNDDHEDKASGLNTHHADSYLLAKLPSSGTYYVHLSDTQRKGGPECSYRLRVSAPRPDFELRVVPSSVNARGGTCVPITVFALRKDGFAGEIKLALKDAPRGCSLSGARVPANQDSVRLTLAAAPQLQRDPIRLQLEGRAAIQGQMVLREALPAEDMMQAFAYRHLVPAQSMVLAVPDRGMGREAVKILSATPVRIPAGGTARVEVSLPPRLAGQVQLELSDPPDGITLQSAAPARGSTELVLKAEAGKVKAGTQGNLILNAFLDRPGQEKNKANANRRRAPLGTLPAISFDVVEP